jgi:hypothetical protein
MEAVMIRIGTLTRALTKVGIPLEMLDIQGDGVRLDLGHGAEVRLIVGDDGRFASILVRDIVNREPTIKYATDATNWRSRRIAEWASARYAGRREIKGVNVLEPGEEYWFAVTVSRNYVARHGSPGTLAPESDRVRYRIVVNDQTGIIVRLPSNETARHGRRAAD